MWVEGDVFFEEDALRYLMISEASDVAAVAPSMNQWRVRLSCCRMASS